MSVKWKSKKQNQDFGAEACVSRRFVSWPYISDSVLIQVRQMSRSALVKDNVDTESYNTRPRKNRGPLISFYNDFKYFIETVKNINICL